MHRLKVFENKVMMGMYGPKRNEIIGRYTQLHEKEVLNLTIPQI
jgi:hypothetical protein